MIQRRIKYSWLNVILYDHSIWIKPNKNLTFFWPFSLSELNCIFTCSCSLVNWNQWKLGYHKTQIKHKCHSYVCPKLLVYCVPFEVHFCCFQPLIWPLPVPRLWREQREFKLNLLELYPFCSENCVKRNNCWCWKHNDRTSTHLCSSLVKGLKASSGLNDPLWLRVLTSFWPGS